jgi:hypothetical protein
MIDRDLLKHAREFKGYIDNHKYEVSDEGIEFPRAKVMIFGEYEDNYGRTPNLIPTEGLNHILGVALANVSKLNNFYLALFSGNYTPVAGLTAATFTSAATEIISGTEGYSEATRRAWVPAAAAGGVIDNYATKASFTIATATQVTIRGAALLSDAVKGSTSGVLISAARYTNDRIEYAGNQYNLGYRVTAQGT